MLTKFFDLAVIKRKLLFKKGASIDVTNTDGTVSNVSLQELAAIDFGTAGTAVANKAVILGASKEIATITSATITTLTGTTANVPTMNAGASGTAGSVNVFPTTAANGKIIIQAADAGGAFNTVITNGTMAATRTLTIQDPLGNANIVTSIGIGAVQTTRCTTQFDAVTGTTGTTLTNVVGMTAQSVVVGTYKFRVHVAGTSTVNSGLKLGFKLTTAVIGVIDYTSLGITATSLVAQHGTTNTDQMSLLASTTAIINGTVEGTMTVTTAGTIGLQAAQNAAHADTTSVYVGSFMEFTRIA